MIKLKCQKYLIIFFINVAKDIGSSNIKSDQSHPSISTIIANTPDIENLVFHDIKEDFIIKQIKARPDIFHKNMFYYILLT
jgi:hypothetical protein